MYEFVLQMALATLGLGGHEGAQFARAADLGFPQCRDAHVAASRHV
jgi:hypothetical protein